MTVAVAAPLGVKKTVLVAASQAIAFEVFTARFAAWWPMPSHHIGQAECVDVVVEPRVGGRWFERGSDGSECDWGRVLTWEPPSRVVLAWQLAANWTFDPSLRTEVEVRFVAVDAGHTRVELEHRGLEAYGPEALAMRDAFASASGWAGMLEHYAEVAGR
ncbi:MAG TPA: SRPBCC family protein [Caldimonas sp.]